MEEATLSKTGDPMSHSGKRKAGTLPFLDTDDGLKG